VNSLTGAGTTFHIYLPASGKEVPVKEKAVLLKGCGKILVMDDDEFLKELSNYCKYGFKGMMPKPFDAYSLGKILNDVLKGNKQVKEN